MAKKLTTAERIRRYMETHPNAKPKDIAHDLGVSVKYVHVLRSKDKKAKTLGLPIRRIKRNYTKSITLVKKSAPSDALEASGLPRVGDVVGGLTLTREMKNGRFEYRWVRKAPAQGIDEMIKKAEEARAEMAITMEEPKDDPVNHPSHYKVGGIETIDFIEAKGLNYNLGNVVKYITRADHKGNRKQDLEKAMWYLKREIGAQ